MNRLLIAVLLEVAYQRAVARGYSNDRPHWMSENADLIDDVLEATFASQ